MNGILVGYGFLVSYVACSALTQVFLGDAFLVSNPYDYLFIVFSLASGFYLLIEVIKRKNCMGISGNSIKLSSDFILLNFFTVGNWAGFYVALAYLSAPVVSALFAGLVPIFTLMINRIMRPSADVHLIDWISPIVLLLFSIIWIVSQVSVRLNFSSVIGPLIIIIASLCMAATVVILKRISDKGYQASTVMAHRFYLLIIVAFYASSPVSEIANLIIENWLTILFVTMLGTIFSLLALQKGIERCEPVVTQLIIASTPAVTLIFFAVSNNYKKISVDIIWLPLSILLVAVVHATFIYSFSNGSGHKNE